MSSTTNTDFPSHEIKWVLKSVLPNMKLSLNVRPVSLKFWRNLGQIQHDKSKCHWEDLVRFYTFVKHLLFLKRHMATITSLGSCVYSKKIFNLCVWYGNNEETKIFRIYLDCKAGQIERHHCCDWPIEDLLIKENWCADAYSVKW